MKKLTALYKAAIRAVFGYEFTCWHLDTDGDRKVFHCRTYEEAFAWVSCALNCSTVKILDRNGYLICQRNSVA